MGETRRDALRICLKRSLKPEFHGSKVTSDTVPLVFRELDGAFGECT